VSYRYRLGLLSAVGVEIEYMIVDRETLSVRPIADELLQAQAGRIESEIEVDDLSWSNELALHVIELKTTVPAPSLAGIAARFQDHVGRIHALLERFGATLLPSAMHPWMQPEREFRRWPHEYGTIYETFDRIFDCRGHGWSNLQSTHLNLPFGDDEEFGRLHAALRLVLPILPALAASSPVADGRRTGWCDTRLDVYRTNARRVPSVSGAVVPEPVFTRADYEGSLLRRVYDDLAPHDPSGVLRHEWVNARGCIARFDRGSIEIRVLDTQECPRADLAIATAAVAAVRGLVTGALSPVAEQRGWATEPLAAMLLETARDGDHAVLRDAAYLRALGHADDGPCSAGDLWRGVIERTLGQTGGPEAEAALPVLRHVLDRGCLARRIEERLDGDTSHGRLREVYFDLNRCLLADELFA